MQWWRISLIIYILSYLKYLRICDLSWELTLSLNCFPCVVLGWMISLSVEPGIEPGTFIFQSQVFAGFWLHHFPLCIPPPLSSFSLSFSLSLCFSFRSSSTFFPVSLLLFLAEKLTTKKRVSFYSRHSTHNPFLQPIKIPLGGPLSFFLLNGLKVDYWNSGEYFSFLSHHNGGVSSFRSDYCPARQIQTNPLLSRATVSLTFMSTPCNLRSSNFCSFFLSWKNIILYFEKEIID